MKIFLAVILICGAALSCNRDEVFEKEQYKNVFSLVSGTDHISTWVHDLRKPESVGYVTASLGGTNPSEQDIRIHLAEDAKLIDAYNSENFDVNLSRYVSPLAQSKYTLDTYDFTIPAGEVSASLPVKIRPGGLSPDSSYFIALKVDAYSAYEVVPESDFVLYRVQIRNWWSSYGGTVYNQIGYIVQTGSSDNPATVFGTKRLYPLSGNTVRVLVGNEINDASDPVIFRNRSIKLTIGDDDQVTISPFSDHIIVHQIDGDEEYPNVVVLHNDRFRFYKTFLLCYSYVGVDGVTYTMKEELRIDYVPDTKDPRFLTE